MNTLDYKFSKGVLGTFGECLRYPENSGVNAFILFFLQVGDKFLCITYIYHYLLQRNQNNYYLYIPLKYILL